jgi:pyridoxamine 5'-phosphate oxidase
MEPLATLEAWVREAHSAGLPEPDAMTLATVDADGRPSARIVSLRRVEHGTLVFTSALWTRKARDLRANPHVAAVLYWATLGRQAQVHGTAEPAERALAEELFARRDRPHQLQAQVSRQGEEIEGLAALRERLAAIRAVPCPPDWGAYRIHPEAVEYWTAAPDALHDRVLFTRDAAGWRQTRLAP